MKQMTSHAQNVSFYGFLLNLMITLVTKHKGLAAHILLPVGSGIDFILQFLFDDTFQLLGHFMIIQH